MEQYHKKKEKNVDGYIESFPELKEELNRFIDDKAKRILKALKDGGPILGGMNETMPEVSTALGIASWFIAKIQGKVVASDQGPDMIDRGGEMVDSNFMCSLIRAGFGMIEAEMLPRPSMLMAATSPCDANVMLGQALFDYEPWKNIPRFIVDVPYEKTEEHMEYFAEQQRKLLAFIEKNSGKKLSLERLKEVAEESNKEFQLMQELQDLKKAVPCPVQWNWGSDAYYVARLLAPGDPEGTRFLEKLLHVHEERYKKGLGVEGVEEKFRYIWFDVLPVFKNKIFYRVEQEFGGAMIMDLYAYNPPWTIIDTSTEESMFRSFARRYAADNPMTRQAMATMNMYTEDIKRIVQDFNIEAVILPVHRGHKDVNASSKIIRDMCKKIGVPFTTIGCDMFDERYMSSEQIIDKMVLFFQSAGLI